jgi:major vault protein
MADDIKNRDLLLNPDTYMYMQNEGKNGMISVFVGPGVVNQTGQDKPVVYDPANRKYRSTNLEAAVQQFVRAEEGDYVILENPSMDDKFPTESQQQAAQLSKGRKIVLAGPWSKALWPGQSAKVIQGHRLRSNQYLVVTIYNEDEARKNWRNAVVKAAAPTTQTTSTTSDADAALAKVEALQPVDFTVGERIIIKGTEVSFYIPPTGVEVVIDEETGLYVREAVTLEQLEYSILVNESGKKQFPRGPQVVFPEPTEKFLSDKNGNRKFKAMELNNIQGIHLKVIEAYEDEDRQYKEGEELFITGADMAIYFPREQHSVIQYGKGNLKHYSTAIPLGEGRYVMNRQTGEINKVIGPKMLLPDPRKEVIVRRILTDRQCERWYPGNSEALAYNRQLREMTASQPSARSGFVSEGDYKRSSGSVSHFQDFDEGLAAHETAGAAHLAQKMVREMAYTQPRHITLDTKFDGVPTIRIFTGYAVMVVSKSGTRRVVTGPNTILLNYDETLEELTLSTGKPKTTDKLLSTCYLRVINNKISDTVDVETADHVKVNIKLSLCVDFEGPSEKWFDVENYVKFLTDHVRSMLKGAVKKVSCRNFYQNYLTLVRDTILGAKTEGASRTGLLFPQNGMRVTEVEVLEHTILDKDVATILDNFQREVVKQDINLDQARKGLEVTQFMQQIKVDEAKAVHEANMHQIQISLEEIVEERRLEVSKIESEITKLQNKQLEQNESEKLFNISSEGKLLRSKAETEQKQAFENSAQEIVLAKLKAETEAACKRLESAKENLAEAIVALGREDTLVKVAEACRIESFMAGSSMEGAASRLFAGIPLLQQVFERTTKAIPTTPPRGSNTPVRTN